MKITFVGHASLLIETHGVRILSDPWWRGPCFGAQWWPYPRPRTDLVGSDVDYLYISHGHQDHLHPGTLSTLGRAARCLVSDRIDIASTLRDLQFEVVEIGDDIRYELAPGVHCRIMETHGADTLFALEDGERVVVNLNDALHAAPVDVQDRFVARLSALYPRIDYLFCGYGVASHFPNCYDIPGKNREATAARRQAHFNRQWARIVAGLAPRYAFPFAADVVFLESDLQWTNEPTHNSERPTDVFRAAHPHASTRVYDIAPGFTIEGDEVVDAVLRHPLSLAALRRDCSSQIERANTYGTVVPAVFDEVLDLIRSNVARCMPYLREFRGDYRTLIRIRNFPGSIAITKRGETIDVAGTENCDENAHDLVFTTRLHYLRVSLTTRYGHEILFVGSGGIFRYTNVAGAQRMLHREVAIMLTQQARSPASRFGDNSRFMFNAKQRVRALFGARTHDLYDVLQWTEWQLPSIDTARRVDA